MQIRPVGDNYGNMNDEPIFDIDIEPNLEVCRSCWQVGNLISPCRCLHKYHQTCMLRYIRNTLLRSLSRLNQVDTSTVKCTNCNEQIHFLHHQLTHIDCRPFLSNPCNRYVGVGVGIVILAAVTTVVFLEVRIKENVAAIKYGYATAMIVELVTLILVLWALARKYLLVKQIVLYRVLDLIDVGSNSSEDHIIYQGSTIIVGSVQ